MRHAVLTNTKKKKKGAFQKGAWVQERMDKFRHATNMAAAARAMRIALGITLDEVAAFYGYKFSSTPGYWESGKYFGWTEKGLDSYFADLRRIKAAKGPSLKIVK